MDPTKQYICETFGDVKNTLGTPKKLKLVYATNGVNGETTHYLIGYGPESQVFSGGKIRGFQHVIITGDIVEICPTMLGEHKHPSLAPGEYHYTYPNLVLDKHYARLLIQPTRKSRCGATLELNVSETVQDLKQLAPILRRRGVQNLDFVALMAIGQTLGLPNN